MNIALIDDKITNVKLLEHMLKELKPQANIVGTGNSVATGVAMIKEKEPDLVFLDIDMGDGFGFDVLQQTDDQAYAVVFVTAYPSFALKSFAYDPLHYLIKPIHEDELLEALNRFDKRQGIIAPQESAPQLTQQESLPLAKICIPEKDKLRFLLTQDILYLESSGAYVIIYQSNGKQIVSTKPLNNFEEMLAPYQFYRIHDKYLVNLNYVETYIRGRGGSIVLSTEQELPVAVRRRDGFLGKMGYL